MLFLNFVVVCPEKKYQIQKTCLGCHIFCANSTLIIFSDGTVCSKWPVYICNMVLVIELVCIQGEQKNY